MQRNQWILIILLITTAAWAGGCATAPPGGAVTRTVVPSPSQTPPPPVMVATATDLPFDTSGLTFGTNRLVNPGFELASRPLDGMNEVSVTEGWGAFYCEKPYVNEDCGDLARPTYLTTDVSNRIAEGMQAQQWYCAYQTCRAGVYQVFRTRPGEICEVGAQVQSWSANREEGTDVSGNPTGPATSELQAPELRANSTWLIRVDRSGGVYAWKDDVLVSRTFGYDDNLYDRYGRITMRFVATGEQATVFFENFRVFPFMHNDSYIDDAYVYCALPDTALPITPTADLPAAASDRTLRVGEFRPQGAISIRPTVEPSAWDAGGLRRHDVIRVNDQLYMYYEPQNDNPAGDFANIALITSRDGISWTRATMEPVLTVGGEGQWDTNLVDSTVIYDEATGRFHMWYSATNGVDNYSYGFGYATSPDGISWTLVSDGPVIRSGPVGTWDEERIDSVSAIKVGNVFYLFYSATTLTPGFRRQIGCRTSYDGVDWEDCPGNPLMSPDKEIAPFEGIELEQPDALLTDGGWLLAYSGFNPDDPGSYIGLAYSPNARNWERLLTEPLGSGWGPDVERSNPLLYLDEDAGQLVIWYSEAGQVMRAVAPITVE